MELGRATKYVLSSESAVSMVRNDFPPLSVGREGQRRSFQNYAFFFYRCAHTRIRRNTIIIGVYKNVVRHLWLRA